MKATYDREANALSITIVRGRREESVMVVPGVLVHLGRKRQPLEVELVGATAFYSAGTIKKMVKAA